MCIGHGRMNNLGVGVDLLHHCSLCKQAFLTVHWLLVGPHGLCIAPVKVHNPPLGRELGVKKTREVAGHDEGAHAHVICWFPWWRHSQGLHCHMKDKDQCKKWDSTSSWDGHCNSCGSGGSGKEIRQGCVGMEKM